MDRRRESPERNSKDTRDRGDRDDRGGRDRHDRDSHRERDRRYRSRSPGRDRDRDRDRDRPSGSGRDRGGRRDELRDRDRERDRDFARGDRRDDRRERDYRDSRGSGPTGVRGRGDRDRDRGGDRKRPREEDNERRATRSQSPARDTTARLASPLPARALENDASGRPKSRTATPPVAFKVGSGHAGPGHQNGTINRESSGEPDNIQGHTHGTHDSEVMDTDLPVPDTKVKGKASKQLKIEEKNVEEDDDILVEEDDSMAAMQEMLGFGGFGTTKQKKVAGNDVYAVRKEKKTEYRQYMNRVGGFNRPLSPSRD